MSITKIALPLIVALAATTSHSSAQMKTAADFERERDAKPAYRIVQRNGKWQLEKPGKNKGTDGKTDTLAWTEWELESPRYEGLAARPFLKFTDARLGAGVGLNSIGGSFALEGDSLKLGPLMSTRMAGSDPLMQAESSYSKALEGVRSWKISEDGQALTLSGASELRFRLTGHTANAWSRVETKIVRVEPTLGPAMDGDQAPKYLQLEDTNDGSGTGTNWGRFTAERIEGFTFQQVNQYLLEVAVERNPHARPEQRLRLLKVVSQKFLGKITPRPDELMIEVAPNRVASSSNAPGSLLQIRVFGDNGYGDWQPLPGEIKGFRFEEGSKYRLMVRPVGDAPSRAYELTRLLEKMPVTQ